MGPRKWFYLLSWLHYIRGIHFSRTSVPRKRNHSTGANLMARVQSEKYISAASHWNPDSLFHDKYMNDYTYKPSSLYKWEKYIFQWYLYSGTFWQFAPYDTNATFQFKLSSYYYEIYQCIFDNKKYLLRSDMLLGLIQSLEIVFRIMKRMFISFQ